MVSEKPNSDESSSRKRRNDGFTIGAAIVLTMSAGVPTTVWVVHRIADFTHLFVAIAIVTLGYVCFIGIALLFLRGWLAALFGIRLHANLADVAEPGARALHALRAGDVDLAISLFAEGLSRGLGWYSTRFAMRLLFGAALSLLVAFAGLLGSSLLYKQNQLISQQNASLIKQLDRQQEQFAREQVQFIETQKAELVRTIYETRCDKRGDKRAEDCTPAYSARSRAEAVKSYAAIGRLEKRALTSGRTSTTAVHLRNADLRGLDLRDANLSDISLYAAKLTNAQLQNATLNGSDLSLVDLTQAQLTGASLKGARFVSANLFSASFSRATIVECDFRHARGGNISFNGATLRNVVFDRSTLSSAYFEDNGVRSNISMHQVKWNGVSFSGGSIEASTISGQFDNGTFNMMRLSQMSMTNLSMTGTQFVGVSIDGVRLSRVRIAAGAMNGQVRALDFSELSFVAGANGLTTCNIELTAAQQAALGTTPASPCSVALFRALRAE